MISAAGHGWFDDPGSVQIPGREEASRGGVVVDFLCCRVRGYAGLGRSEDSCIINLVPFLCLFFFLVSPPFFSLSLSSVSAARTFVTRLFARNGELRAMGQSTLDLVKAYIAG